MTTGATGSVRCGVVAPAATARAISASVTPIAYGCRISRAAATAAADPMRRVPILIAAAVAAICIPDEWGSAATATARSSIRRDNAAAASYAVTRSSGSVAAIAARCRCPSTAGR